MIIDLPFRCYYRSIPLSEVVILAILAALPPTLLACATLLVQLRLLIMQVHLRREVNGRLDQLVAAERGRARAEAALQLTPPPLKHLPPPTPPPGG